MNSQATPTLPLAPPDATEVRLLCVHSCSWHGHDCSHDNFVERLTDFGLCYTFNSGRDGQRIFKATQTGH